MSQVITARLARNDAQPWGFRLQGGKDFGTPLVIQKVSYLTFTRVHVTLMTNGAMFSLKRWFIGRNHFTSRFLKILCRREIGSQARASHRQKCRANDSAKSCGLRKALLMIKFMFHESGDEERLSRHSFNREKLSLKFLALLKEKSFVENFLEFLHDLARG